MFKLVLLSNNDTILFICFSFFTAIGRTLIPRYFRSIFEGGVTDLYYHLRANATKESFHNTSLTLDCDHCTMVTTHLTSSGGPPSSIPQSPGPGGPGSVGGGQPTSLNGGIGMQKSLVSQGPPSSQQSGMYIGQLVIQICLFVRCQMSTMG